MPDSADLLLSPRRGLPQGLLIPGSELVERFSRSSGPGGQSVNTTDSRVELRWDVAASAALPAALRERLLRSLGSRLHDGELRLVASGERSQLRNRQVARDRLARLVAEAAEPPSPARRATRPSRAARARRVEAKRRHGATKARRRRPDDE